MSYLFNNASAAITFPDAAALDSTGTYTVSFWVNLTAAAAAMVPVGKGGNYFAYMDYSYGERTINANYNASGTVMRSVSTTDVTMTMMIGAWHNIVARTSGDVTGPIWIDGVARTEGIEDPWFAATRDLTQALILGNNTGLTTPLTGYLAEVAIWNNLSIADARVGDIAGGLSPVNLSTPPTWYARLKTDAVEYYSSVAGTVSLATQNASHPTVADPSGGGGGTTSPRNKVFAVI